MGTPATGVLVETLLERGADGDEAEAEAAIDQLAAAQADEGLVIRDIWLLRLQALLAKAHGDKAAYANCGIATAIWRKSLASKDISTGPRRCHDQVRSVPVVHYQNPGSLRTNVVDFSNIASAAGPPHQPECRDLDQPSPCAGMCRLTGPSLGGPGVEAGVTEPSRI